MVSLSLMYDIHTLAAVVAMLTVAIRVRLMSPLVILQVVELVRLQMSDLLQLSFHRILLRHIIVIQPRLSPFLALRHNYIPCVHPLAVLFLETPNLFGLPAVADTNGVGLDSLAILCLRQPIASKMCVFDVSDLDEAGLALNLSEDVVVMLVLNVVEMAVLGRAFDAAGSSLLDINVDDAVIGGILFDVEGDSGKADGFAGQPADTLLYACQRRG